MAERVSYEEVEAALRNLEWRESKNKEVNLVNLTNTIALLTKGFETLGTAGRPIFTGTFVLPKKSELNGALIVYPGYYFDRIDNRLRIHAISGESLIEIVTAVFGKYKPKLKLKLTPHERGLWTVKIDGVEGTFIVAPHKIDSPEKIDTLAYDLKQGKWYEWDKAGEHFAKIQYEKPKLSPEEKAELEKAVKSVISRIRSNILQGNFSRVNEEDVNFIRQHISFAKKEDLEKLKSALKEVEKKSNTVCKVNRNLS